VSSANERPAWPPVLALHYESLRPTLTLVRVMRNFLNEVVEKDPELRPHYATLDVAYIDLIQRELAPHAYAMAVMLVALEDAYAQSDDARPQDESAGAGPVNR
jgi:hypothetical protein